MAMPQTTQSSQPAVPSIWGDCEKELQFMRYKVLCALLIAVFCVVQLSAQTITTGQLAGTVTDPSGAVVANTDVQLKSLDEGSVTNGKTSTQGYYQFAYLKPGN